MTAVLERNRAYRVRFFTGIFLCGLFMLGSPFGAAQSTKKLPPSEYLVKAALLTKFLKFVDWPPGDTLVIRVIGKEPMDDYFEDFLSKTFNSRRLEIRRHRKYKEGMVLDDCQLLFISRSEKRHTDELLEAVRGLKVLTVGETKGFVDNGGMINFVTKGNKIRFEVNQQVSTETGLRIRTPMLRQAVRVVKKNSGK